MKFGEKGVAHGFESIMLKDEKRGKPAPVYSIASGLDYPSVGPEHAFLHDLGRVKYETVSDEQAMEAFFKLSWHEGIIPAIESSCGCLCDAPGEGDETGIDSRMFKRQRR